MKKKIIMFLLLLLFPCFVFAEEKENNIVVNTNKLIEQDSSFSYKTLKLSDGYLVVDNYTNSTTYLDLKKIDFSGTVIWEKDYSYLGEWSYGEHFDAYLLSDTEAIVANNSGLFKIDLTDGKMLKENIDVGCYELIEYGDKLLCVGDAIFHAASEEPNNKLYIVDYNLNVSSSINFTDTSMNLISATVENDKIYAFVYPNNGQFGDTFYIKTFDEKFQEINSSVVNMGNNYLQDFGTIHFQKIGDEFLYLCHYVYKIDNNGNFILFDGGWGGKNTDYTSMKIMNDYIIMAGLYNDGEGNLNAIIKIYDNNLVLKKTIDINELFGVDKAIFKNDEISVVKDVMITEGGFTATGLLNEDVSFLVEYKIPYVIDTNIDKNGMIEVIEEAFYGDVITFKVIPRTGYKLSTLSVTNSLLEKVTFTEDDLVLKEDGTVSISVNSFTMPSSDVEISATFEKIPENPNTIDNIVLYTGMFVVSLSLVIVITVYKKKHL